MLCVSFLSITFKSFTFAVSGHTYSSRIFLVISSLEGLLLQLQKPNAIKIKQEIMYMVLSFHKNNFKII